MHNASKYWDPRQVDIDVGDNKRVFRDRDGVWRFQHECHVPESDAEYDIIAAPTLQMHAVSYSATTGIVTVMPSIRCVRCETHGFVVDGVWKRA